MAYTTVGVHPDDDAEFPVQLVPAERTSKGVPFVAVKLDDFTTLYPTLAALDKMIAAFEDARALLVDSLALLEPSDATPEEMTEAREDAA